MGKAVATSQSYQLNITQQNQIGFQLRKAKPVSVFSSNHSCNRMKLVKLTAYLIILSMQINLPGERGWGGAKATSLFFVRSAPKGHELTAMS